jgi:hypothetical protein
VVIVVLPGKFAWQNLNDLAPVVIAGTADEQQVAKGSAAGRGQLRCSWISISITARALAM